MFTELLLLASTLRATTYGYGELMCGDIGKPVTCTEGRLTASGAPLNPNRIPSAALPAPSHLQVKPQVIFLRAREIPNGPCVGILLLDKSNPRWIGRRGLDLTPAALRALGIRPRKSWSGRVELCEPRFDKAIAHRTS